jgi:hypothetical protein
MALRLTMLALVTTLGATVAGGAEPAATKPAADAAPAPRGAASPAPAEPFAVGDLVEAKRGNDWVPGTVTRVRPARAGAVELDVVLENGQRDVVPARMLRKTSR